MAMSILTWPKGASRRELSPQELIGWASRVTAIQFSSQRVGSQAPDSRSIVNTADWRRQLSPLTDVTTAVQFEWQSLDNAYGHQQLHLAPDGRVQHRLTKQLTLKVCGGAAITTTRQDVMTPIPPATMPLPSGTKLGWLGDALLVYKLKTTEFSIFAGRSVAPSALGDLQERSTVSHQLSAGHQSNLELYADRRIFAYHGATRLQRHPA